MSKTRWITLPDGAPDYEAMDKEEEMREKIAEEKFEADREEERMEEEE